MDSIVVPRRFNGPDDSGNGGYSCGLVAGVLGAGPAEVTLRAPPPLDRELAVERTGDGVVVRDGDTVVAEARAADVDVDPPAPVAFDEAAAAGPHGMFVDAGNHPFPHCFVCGPLREEGDGLRIFAGPVGGGDVLAASWIPDPGLAADDGGLPNEVIWSALDCPTSGPVANDWNEPDFKPIVLARFAVRIDAPVIAGEPHVMLSWPLAVDGRKREAAAALYDAEGDVCAVSRALWIELRTAY